ncbi:MAG: chemotaxis protein CheW [Thermodesulfobacteriota bacterium]
MSTILQLVGFKVDKEFFGVPIEKVKEIVRVPDITAVPDTPDFLEGVINLRGRIVPVVDMRTRIGLPTMERVRTNRVLILDIDGRTVGLIVDSASEILKLPDEQIESTPELVSSVGAEYVTAVGKLDDKLIVLVDITRLLSADEMGGLDAVRRRAELTASTGKEAIGGKSGKALEEGTGQQA